MGHLRNARCFDLRYLVTRRMKPGFQVSPSYPDLQHREDMDDRTRRVFCLGRSCTLEVRVVVDRLTFSVASQLLLFEVGVR